MSLLVAALLATFGEVARGQGPPPGESVYAERTTLRVGTVAVVPFDNISGSPTDDWLGTGIAETVGADLQQFPTLSVVGREALLASLNDGRVKTPQALGDLSVARDVARELGVAWIVTGGFQRLGDQLRITARIVNVETGDAREAAKVDGSFDEVFALQDRVVAGFEGISGFRGISGQMQQMTPPLVSAVGPETAVVGDTPRQARVGPGGSAPDGSATGGAFSPSPVASASPATSVGSLGIEGVSVVGREVGTSDAPGDRRPADAVNGGITIGDEQPPQQGRVVSGNAGVLAGRVTARPVRTQTPPDVDGRLDDAVWQDAARITEFVQSQPLDGAPATEDTDIFVAYDNSNIYLAFHAKYDDPGIMRANRVDRDRAGFSDDTFSVYFDPFLDQQRAYVFSVNGYGVQGDAIVAGTDGGGGFGGGGHGGGGRGGRGRGRGGIPRGDSSWDALFSTGGQLVEDGFTAEMAIPFKSLRYPQRGSDVPHTWGFQIVREIRGKDETVVWSPVSRDIAGFLPQMGVLDGLLGLSTSRNLEIQPTFTAFRFSTLNEDTGRVVDGDPKPEGGANFKYGVTSNLTADFTINPDFSQIESDRPQVEVNQRFALFFPELRPFFLEGAEIFQIQAPMTVVHTRTIVDPLYGAKLTGKAGNTTLGMLYANDAGASIGLDDPLSPGYDQSAQTLVGRFRYDLYSESFIGAVFTDREFLDGFSRVAGIDSNFRVGATHELGFRALRSDHREETDQLNENDGLQTDGYLLDFGFRKQGRNLSYSADAFVLSPDFKTDVGFVRRTDMRRYDATAQYQWWPQSWIISWGPEVRYGLNYNFDQVLEDENFSTRLAANFAKNIRYSFGVDRDMERYEGINFEKRRYAMFGHVNTSSVISFGGGYNWGDEVFFDAANPFLGRESGLRGYIGFRPVSRFQSQINISTSRFTDPNGFFVPGVNEGERDESGLVFNVNIFRAMSTYQFTDRLLFRNITEFNTYDETLGLNFLFTYRVNSGTAFYIGYDDHYRQRQQFEDQVNITGTGYQQTNRAIFTKFQYLFRF